MDVVPYDPPRAIADPTFRSAHYDELFACDILTFHVPLTTAGPHPTHHLVDGAFLGGVRPGAIVINTSRGGVVDSAALIEALRGGRIGAAVLDVWEGEPAVPVDLVESVAIATPHIAGYSTDAKLRGTAMMADAMARFTGGASTWSPTHALPARAAALELPRGVAPLDAAHHAVRAAYDITRDDADIRALLALGDEERRARFDRLRKNYRLRREFSAFEVASDDRAILELLTSLGFSTASRAPQ
jgi:erythronate-4-phosphate dehydrogenase